MRRLLLLLLCVPLWGQVQGNRPELRYSENGVFTNVQPNANQSVLTDGVNINDTIDVCINTFDGLQTAYGVTDSLGNTYTLTAGTATPSQSDTKGFVYHAYTRSGFAGADTITVAQPSPNATSIMIATSIYSGLNGVDGTVAVATRDRPIAGISALSTSNTTTLNGDVLSTCTGAGIYNQDSQITPSTNEYNSYGANAGGVNISQQHQHAGAAGSQTATVNTFADNAFNGPDTFAMQTLAFKPDAIKITDTVMPDGCNGCSYSAQLHGIGGTAAQTYSCTGLPSNGLSLNTTTGVISGTATTGTVSIGCTTTDGVTTSGTASLTIHIYASLLSPNVRAIFVNQSDPQGSWQTVSGGCGDILVVFARGVDAHYADGVVQLANSTNSYLRGTSAGTTINFRRVEGFMPGVMASGWEVFVSDALPVNGSIALTFASSVGGSTANPVSLVLDVSGGEVVDQAIGTSVMTSATSGTWGGSYTSLVNNTLLLSASMSDTSTPYPTLTGPTSPFSVLYSGASGAGTDVATSNYASAFLTTPSTANATMSYSVTYGSNRHYTSWMQSLLPIRPAPASNSCPAPAGEHIRWWSY